MKIFFTGSATFPVSHTPAAFFDPDYWATGKSENVIRPKKYSKSRITFQDGREASHGNHDVNMDTARPASPLHYRVDSICTCEIETKINTLVQSRLSIIN